MIRALRQLFSFEPSDAGPGQATLPSDEAGRLMKLATVASVSVATVLIGVKLVAWLMTDSISVLSSLVDSLLDVLASLVNMFAVYHALQPADREHRFGHGKAEPLAGLGQAAFITGTGVLLLIKAVSRLVSPQAVTHVDIGVGVMVFAIVITGALVVFQNYVVRKTGSTAIGADALHYKTDVLVNLSVIVSLGLSASLGWHIADPLFGIAIGLFLLSSAWKIALRSLDLLMDREFPDDDRMRIREIAMQHPKVEGMHDLRTRRAGLQPFIQLHLELDGDMTLFEAHEIADQVEAQIKQAYPAAEVLIHQDPEGLEEPTPEFH
jgi:ferrous-iron efflux pump FieF